jgi:Fic family protein
VRLEGDWEAWLDYFAEAVEVSASQALATAQDLLALVQRDAQRIAALGKARASAAAVHAALQRQPVTTAPALVKTTGLTAATVNSTLRALQAAGVVRETSARKRGRVYAYEAYVALLNAELD